MGFVVRHGFIDNARAIAILLVVFGHTDGVAKNVITFIYSFHMPAFFFMSGFLLRNSKLQHGPFAYMKSQARSLLIPYLFFGFLSTIYLLVSSAVKHMDISLGEAFIGLLLGNAEDLVNTVLWFFTCLFSMSVTYYFLARVTSGRSLWVLCLLISLFAAQIFDSKEPRLPWDFELALVGLFFYASGHYLANYDVGSFFATRSARSILFLLVGSGILFFLTVKSGRVDMAFMKFGNPILFVLNASIGIALLMAIASMMPVTRLSMFLSKNTIVIFPLHPLFFSVFTGVAMLGFGLPHSFQETLPWSLTYTLVAILLSIPASRVLFRYFPFFLGRN